MGKGINHEESQAQHQPIHICRIQRNDRGDIGEVRIDVMRDVIGENTNTTNVGDKVYLSTKNLVTNEGSKKLSDLRTGPFTILKKVGEGAYKPQLLKHMKLNPVFNVALLTKANPDPIGGRVPTEPAPIILNREEEYIIKKFLDSNWLGKHFQYKVTYDRYGKEHDEWLFRDDLLEDLGEESLLDFEKEFYTRHPKAKRHTDTVRVRQKGQRTIKK